MKITEIPFVGYPVTDVDRSRAFYEKVLGFELTMHHVEKETGNFWIEYNVGQSCLAISNAWLPAEGRGGATAAFEVDDIEAAVREVDEAGYPAISEIMQSPSCRFVLIADPDGNHILLHHVKES